MSRLAVYAVQAVKDAEGDRRPPAMVTPEGTWVSVTDKVLWKAMAKVNERRWNARLRK